MLNILDKWIDETPPVQQAQRFGNQAFRTFHGRLTQVRRCSSLPVMHSRTLVIKPLISEGLELAVLQDASEILQEALPGTTSSSSVEELKAYLLDSFGNSTRIDYGTGNRDRK